MTPAEYVQLKAFARIDGLGLSLLWMSSFVCYLIGFSSSVWSIVAVVLGISSLFFVAKRLCYFRDFARDGIISFQRGWAFVALVFFYAAVIFALAQYAYFAYLDHGYLMQSVNQMISLPETQLMINQYGMGEALNESLQELQSLRPIDVALNILTTNIMVGMFIGIPIAAIFRSSVSATNKEQ
jgi:hypothetical protein